MAIYDDVRTMLLNGLYQAAVDKYGAAEVRDEIDAMIYHDLADKALMAAEALGYDDFIKTARRVVSNSGGYEGFKKSRGML